MKQTACCLLSFFLLLCDGLSAQTTEKQDSMPSSPQQRIKPSRISLSSLTDGLMNTIRLTGVELKKVGKRCRYYLHIPQQIQSGIYAGTKYLV